MRDRNLFLCGERFVEFSLFVFMFTGIKKCTYHKRYKRKYYLEQRKVSHLVTSTNPRME